MSNRWTLGKKHRSDREVVWILVAMAGWIVLTEPALAGSDLLRPLRMAEQTGPFDVDPEAVKTQIQPILEKRQAQLDELFTFLVTPLQEFHDAEHYPEQFKDDERIAQSMAQLVFLKKGRAFVQRPIEHSESYQTFSQYDYIIFEFSPDVKKLLLTKERFPQINTPMRAEQMALGIDFQLVSPQRVILPLSMTEEDRARFRQQLRDVAGIETQVVIQAVATPGLDALQEGGIETFHPNDEMYYHVTEASPPEILRSRLERVVWQRGIMRDRDIFRDAIQEVLGEQSEDELTDADRRKLYGAINDAMQPLRDPAISRAFLQRQALTELPLAEKVTASQDVHRLSVAL